MGAMWLPQAHHVLWFLGGFLAAWGLSVLARLPGRWRLGLSIWAWAAAGLGTGGAGVACFAAGESVRRWVYQDSGLPVDVTAPRIAAVGVFAFAIVVACKGLWGDRARGRKRCPRCWYDMAGVAAAGRLVCPECGHEAKKAADLERARVSRRTIVGAGLLVLLAAMVPWVWNVRQGGIKSMLPTTVMIAGVWWWPDEWLENAKTDDQWTLEQRLKPKRCYEWQREWLKHKFEDALAKPTSFERVFRVAKHYEFGHKVTEDTYLFAWRHLGSDDPEVRARAIEFEDKLGPKMWLRYEDVAPNYDRVREIRAELLKALHQDDAKVCFRAGWLLCKVRLCRDEVLRAWLARYPDELDAGVTEELSSLLLRHFPESSQAHDAVCKALGHRDKVIVERVLRAIAYAGYTQRLPPDFQAALVKVFNGAKRDDLWRTSTQVLINEPNRDDEVVRWVVWMATKQWPTAADCQSLVESSDLPWPMKRPLFEWAMTSFSPELIESAMQLTRHANMSEQERWWIAVRLSPLVGAAYSPSRSSAKDLIRELHGVVYDWGDRSYVPAEVERVANWFVDHRRQRPEPWRDVAW